MVRGHRSDISLKEQLPSPTSGVLSLKAGLTERAVRKCESVRENGNRKANDPEPEPKNITIENSAASAHHPPLILPRPSPPLSTPLSLGMTNHHCKVFVNCRNHETGSPHHVLCRVVPSVSLPQLLPCIWCATANDDVTMPRHHTGPYAPPHAHTRLPANYTRFRSPISTWRLRITEQVVSATCAEGGGEGGG